MTDIFREVEEDVRRERIEKIWKQYSDYIIAGVAVVVLAVGGWQYWKYYHGQQLAQASEDFIRASNQAGAGDLKSATASFAKLAKEAPSGYAALAQMQQANALAAAGQVGDAVKIYQTIETGSDPSLAAVARLRHAWAVVDFSSKADVEAILAPLNLASSEWKYAARELLAYSEYHNGNPVGAAAAFKALSTDSKAPQNLRQRAQAMAGFLGAGAGRDVGTLPPPDPPATPILPGQSVTPAPNNGTATP